MFGFVSFVCSVACDLLACLCFVVWFGLLVAGCWLVFELLVCLVLCYWCDCWDVGLL